MNVWRRAVGLLLAVTTMRLADAFQAGAVCSGVGNVTEPPEMLEGKHLRVYADANYAPYSKYDASKTGHAAWSGFDNDMMAAVAKVLKFTYTTHAMTQPVGNLSYTDVLVSDVKNCDVIIGNWAQSAIRRAKMSMLMPLYSNDGILIAPIPTPGTVTLAAQMFTFLEPFTIGLWVMIAVLCIVSGAAIYGVEYNSKRSEDYAEASTHGQGLGVSIYLAFARFTGDGGHAPVTRGGRALAVALGFVIVVILAAYTANLAAFLTLTAQPVFSVGSMSDLISTQRTVCMWTGSQPKFRILYPELRTVGSKDGLSDVSKMRAGKCAAVIADASTWEMLQTDPSNCDVMQIGQPLTREHSAWVVSNQAVCVEAALNYALQSLVDTGEAERLRKRHFVRAACPAVASRGGDSNKLGIPEMGGIFIIYSAIMVSVVIARVIRNFRANTTESGPMVEKPEGEMKATLPVTVPVCNVEAILTKLTAKLEALDQSDKLELILAELRDSQMGGSRKAPSLSPSPSPLCSPSPSPSRHDPWEGTIQSPGSTAQTFLAKKS